MMRVIKEDRSVLLLKSSKMLTMNTVIVLLAFALFGCFLFFYSTLSAGAGPLKVQAGFMKRTHISKRDLTLALASITLVRITLICG